MLYTTYGQFQEQMKNYYQRTGSRLQFPEMMRHMAQCGLLCAEKPLVQIPEDYDHLSVPEFDRLIDSLPLILEEYDTHLIREVTEQDLIPSKRDVFIIRHPRYTRPYVHSHNYFEINYVCSGSMIFNFEQEPARTLHPGELVIIAPGSVHDFYTTEDKTLTITICIRKSTFNTVFFQQMSGNDLLAYFFRTILQGNAEPNFLMFYTNQSYALTRCLRHAMIECSRRDEYSNAAAVNYIQLLFVELLRHYSQTIRFYNYEMGGDFSLVLQYIQHNYRTLTLSELAAFFHYSEPHLCTLIHKNTGHTFSSLVRELRLSDAVRYLTGTNLRIAEIAETVGYRSADHFSRVFRKTYAMSPQDYRRQNQPEQDFVPFRPESSPESSSDMAGNAGR